jgi:uncharacterized damage-inducible protein DinB
MDIEYFKTLYDYNYWTHRKVWECVLTLSDEEFTRDIGYSWKSIRGQLVHVMSAEWAWFSRLGGTSPTAVLAEADYPTREAIRQKWDAVEADVRAHVGGLTTEQLGQVIDYKTTQGAPYSQPQWQILMHAANHSTDHRAQILAMLYQLGAPTVEQDVLFYFRTREQ